jgi:serine/threonine-protein kinase RsbT
VTRATEEVRVRITTDDDIVTARQEGRRLSSVLGFSSTDLTLIATAISEVARNITTYANHGEVALQIVSDGRGRRGIEVVARDEGPGIEDLERALRDGYSSGEGLGLGLPGARRLVDEFRIESAPGEGTKVTLVMWGRPDSRLA